MGGHLEGSVHDTSGGREVPSLVSVCSTGRKNRKPREYKRAGLGGVRRRVRAVLSLGALGLCARRLT